MWSRRFASTVALHLKRCSAYLQKAPLLPSRSAPCFILAAGAAGAAGVPQQSASKVACSSKRNAVLVRMHNPSEAALERLRVWAEDLHSSKTADLWISVDTTWQHLQARERIESAVACWPKELAASVRFHFYTRDDLLKSYPVLLELLQSLAFPVIPGGGHYLGGVFALRDLGWGFHVEAINLWYHQLAGNVAPHDTVDMPCKIYDYVWVFEDDVGFSGNLSVLLERYTEDTSDLISKNYHSQTPRIPADYCWPKNATYGPDGWCWYYTNSTSFRERLENLGASRKVSAEHVQRFSKRFLQELHEWSKADAVAWSEMATPTVCHAVGFRCSTFDSRSLGIPFAYDGRVTRQEWAAVLKDPERANRLYHALKF